jgi:hypothetical protein
MITALDELVDPVHLRERLSCQHVHRHARTRSCILMSYLRCGFLQATVRRDGSAVG